MLPVSSAYFEPPICASNRTACSPAHASLRAVLASAGLSLSAAASPGAPVARAAKNCSATGSGPVCFGVHALSVATTAETVRIAATRETRVAIGADVTNPRPLHRGGAPISAPCGHSCENTASCKSRELRPEGPRRGCSHHQRDRREVRRHL